MSQASEDPDVVFSRIPSADELIEESRFEVGTKLFQMGKPMYRALYLIREGSVMLTSKNDSTVTKSAGEYFGEETLISSDGALSAYTATIVGDQDALLGVLAEDGFQRIVRVVTRLDMNRASVRTELNSGIQDKYLEKIRVLGRGAFGKVWLVRDTRTKSSYALKVMDKRFILSKNRQHSILNEKNILSLVDHPLILNLVNAYQDETSLYMLTNLIQGGQVFALVQKENGLPRNQVQFYGACVVESLFHLHSRGILYRDLKPENTLIDEFGYCVLIDLGFAKRLAEDENKTFTFCGTLEYLAPEMIINTGHSYPLDCWTLGNFFYEIFYVDTAFYQEGNDQMQLFKDICRCDLKFPRKPKIPETLKDLIMNLIVTLPSLRHKCGTASNPSRNVQNHAFFDGFDWEKLVKRELAPPWVPTITSGMDSSNFGKLSEEPRDSPSYFAPLTEEEQEIFASFV